MRCRAGVQFGDLFLDLGRATAFGDVRGVAAALGLLDGLAGGLALLDEGVHAWLLRSVETVAACTLCLRCGQMLLQDRGLADRWLASDAHAKRQSKLQMSGFAFF